MNFSNKPSRQEILWGCIYLILYLAVMPWLVPLGAWFLAPKLDAARVNFLYFAINFTATIFIFRKYLYKSLKGALKSPAYTLLYALLAFLGSQILGTIVGMFILRVEPEFANVNDMAINAMVSESFGLMAIGAVVLVPITEELLFRGLVFRGLYDRSPLLAHLASIGLFSLIHVTNYIGVYEVRLLALCFLQYLVPAYCLNFAYRRSGNIFAPILMHMLTNLAALAVMR